MTVAEFNVAQKRKAAAAAAMHAYVNLPPKLIGRAEADPPPPLPQKDVGYASAENSPQHRSKFPPSFVPTLPLIFIFRRRSLHVAKCTYFLVIINIP